MRFTRAFGFWVVIAVVIINVAGGIYASLTGEGMHAFLHGAAAVGFGLWARHLRQTPVISHSHEPDKVELLQDDVSDLQRQLDEARARLEFDEQLLRPRDQ